MKNFKKRSLQLLSLVIALTLTASLSWARAKPTIVLLTSIEPQDVNNAWERSLVERTLVRIKTDFKDKLDQSGYRVLVYNKADQFDLYQNLNDQNVEALIWLSHGAYQQLGAGIGVASILDHNGFDITPVFEAAKRPFGQKPLKYIGIVGCRGNEILKQVLGEDFLKGLPIESFDSTVSATQGLSELTNHLIEKLEQPSPAEQDSKQSEQGQPALLPISVVKTYPQDTDLQWVPSQRVMIGGKLAGVFSSKPRWERVAAQLDLSQIKNKADLKVVVTTGTQIQNKIKMDGRFFGDINMHIPFESQWTDLFTGGFVWKLFAKPTGEPIGVTQRIYLFQSMVPTH